MKKILFIATGGTIASAKTENGLTPAITSDELLNAVPQVKNLCAVDTVQPGFYERRSRAVAEHCALHQRKL